MQPYICLIGRFLIFLFLAVSDFTEWPSLHSATGKCIAIRSSQGKGKKTRALMTQVDISVRNVV